MRWVLQRSRLVLVTALAGSLAGRAAAQSTETGGGFSPGGQTLFATDFTQDAVGDFPRGLKLVKGSLEVVERDGVRMLRSTSPAEFIIPLPEVLPAQFTLEFDIVARGIDCCAGEELAVEGSPTLARTAGSAQLLWHHQWLAILGGGRDMSNSTVKVSETLQAELLGQLGHVQIAFDGPSMKLWTNGVRLYNLPELAFRRSNVLRVFLGGTDEGDRAVYLARVRVAGSGGASAPASAPQLSAPTLQVTVTPGQMGPVAQWTAITGATYVVRRWNTADSLCCGAAYAALSNTTWLDNPLPKPGTYVYEVTATAPAGTFPTGLDRAGTTAVATAEFATQATGTAPATPSPLTISVQVALGTGGPVVQWSPVQAAVTYTVQRHGPNQCCTATRQGLTDPTWYDGMLPQTGSYTYAVTALDATGATLAAGSTQVVADSMWVTGSSQAPAMVLLTDPVTATGTTKPISACAVPATASGFGGPIALIADSVRKSPVGAGLSWEPPQGVVGYAVERSGDVAGTLTPIATSCDTPDAFQLTTPSSGPTRVQFRDRSGGIRGGTIYTYVVRAFGPGGSAGWTSVKWKAPYAPSPFLRVNVSGSTVSLDWCSSLTTEPLTGQVIAPPNATTLTTSYGYTLEHPSCTTMLRGVPIGTHTITVTVRWDPDVSRTGTATVTITP